MLHAKLDQGKWGYVDDAGQWVIPALFSAAREFDSHGWAAVAVNGASSLKWGFINSTGSWEAAAQFDDVGDFDKEKPGFARVRIGNESFGKYQLLSRSGELLPETGGPAVARTLNSSPPPASSTATSSTEERLRELKRLFDLGLVTGDVYRDLQLEVLNSRNR